MIRDYLIILTLSGLVALGGCKGNSSDVASDSTSTGHAILASADSPATQPAAAALPPGHPDITDKPDQPAAPTGSLPAGHPDISQMLNNPNSSGAANAAMPVGVNLPAGHPDLSKMKAPSTQPMASGSVTIRAVQETTGGPAIGADSFSLELYVQSQLLDKIEGKLDSQATAIVRGIPLIAKAQPVIKVTHAGVIYQVSGEPIDDQNPSLQVQIPVYETTSQTPEWQIRMRHVMVSHAEGMLRVMEMLAIDNPTDRAWLGNDVAGGKHTTFSVTLPSDAKDIQVLGGFDASSTQVDGNKLTNFAALNPGSTQYQLAYSIPIVEGKADLTIASPATAQTIMIFVPDDGTVVKAQGAELAGSSDMGNGKTRFYKAADVAIGQQVKLALSGIVETAKPVATSGLSSAHLAQIVAGTGAAVILLFGIAFIFIKGSSKKTQSA